ncbi:MAG TPA: hypothetical protein VFE25_05625 [Opitutaceae bacterium]|jgi:hypothetical protein|nr:hypothetical protein [Opitutaceae bacterium]
MKCLTLLAALVFTAAVARSETFDVGVRGSYSVTPPKGWTASAQPEEDSGLAVTLTAPAGVNASAIVNLTFVPKEEAVSKDQLKEAVLALGDKFADQSVEKKKTLREFSVSQGYGYYCVFTDASMVGQPSKKDSFKVVAVGIVHMNDDLLATIGLSFDDEKGPEFAALLSTLSSASFTPRK